jgi:hypothetical protein
MVKAKNVCVSTESELFAVKFYLAHQPPSQDFVEDDEKLFRDADRSESIVFLWNEDRIEFIKVTHSWDVGRILQHDVVHSSD